ncbi:MAG: GNAT family N-acetyltransferase [Candidatus Lokiarchaeota archaeon]|nr:GNAT family N-acetyltransferase [Candidatus Lokiarchaeota archaeon]
MVNVRNGRMEDIFQLKKLMRQLCKRYDRTFYEESWVLDLKYKFETNPKGIFVAEEENGDIIGMILVDVGRDPYSGAQLAQLQNFVVDEKVRHEGIGSALLDAAIEFCDDYKISSIQINARRQNENLIKLFEKFGFKEIFFVMERESD